MSEPPAGQLALFNLPPVQGSRVKLRAIEQPIWTENKANLIERYLYYFVQVTRHGTYIDGFAGPQKPDHPEMWVAKLVLDSEPKWLRHFYFCEIKPPKIALLEQLRAAQPPHSTGMPRRTIDVLPRDFNEAVDDILPNVGQREATFCLLDQHTFECHWASIEKLARHKHEGHRVEIFYFLCARWFGRAFSAIRNRDILDQWWGSTDWQHLGRMDVHERADLVCTRFRSELGYGSALAWPIYSRQTGGRIAYHMIHATDHEEAPKLMHRAYRCAVLPKETPEQLELELEAAAIHA